MTKLVLRMKQSAIRSLHLVSVVLLYICSSLAFSQSSTDEVQPLSEPMLLNEQEIQQELILMRNRLNSYIDEWGKELTRDDFEWTFRGRMLKQTKRIEVCNIFQKVVNETYVLVLRHKSSLNIENQNILKNREMFIQRLGIKNHMIPTKMGFDCIIQ